MSPKMMLAAAAIFVAMFLMRLTLRTSQRRRPDGIRWRGIDWSRAKELSAGATDEPKAPAAGEGEVTGKSGSSASPDSDGSAGG
jgi:hypothetical protein